MATEEPVLEVDLDDRMDKAVAALQEEFAALRTGRASPACSIRCMSTPMARRCRSTRSARSACRSRA